MDPTFLIGWLFNTETMNKPLKCSLHTGTATRRPPSTPPSAWSARQSAATLRTRATCCPRFSTTSHENPWYVRGPSPCTPRNLAVLGSDQCSDTCDFWVSPGRGVHPGKQLHRFVRRGGLAGAECAIQPDDPCHGYEYALKQGSPLANNANGGPLLPGEGSSSPPSGVEGGRTTW